MLGLLPRLIGVALLHHVEIGDTPVMRPMDLLAPTDDVRGWKLGALKDRLQVFALPAYMIGLFFRDQYGIQEIFGC
jgi:hypothetical protein